MNFGYMGAKLGLLKPVESIPPHYALDDKNHSNFSTRDAESALLEKLGLPKSPQSLDMVDAHHAMIYAAQLPRTDKELIYSAETREILHKTGYDWHSHLSLSNVTPETALYFDAYVRAREFSQFILEEYNKNRTASREYAELINKIKGSA